MYPSRCYVVFVLLIPTLGLALPHRLHGEELARTEGPSARAFSLPIHRRREPSRVGRPGRRSRRDGASGSVGIGDNSDLLYSVPIKLGGITTAVNLDTGSSDLWVISDACNTDICNKSTATRYTASSLTPSGTKVTMNYGDSTTGTFASGPVGKDTATIAGLSLPNQQFAAIDNTTSSAVSFGAAGIFGLGFPSESVIQQAVVNQQFNNPSTTDEFVASTFENGPLLSRLISSGGIENPVFVISLQRDTIDIGGTGQLSVGKFPDGMSNSSFTWVPVRLYSQNDGGLAPPNFASNETYPYRWEIPLDGVFLDGQKLADSTVSGKGVNSTSVSALIDTGNSLIRGPKDVVQNIMSTVSPSYASAIASNPNAQATLPCSTPHSLAFQIGGQMFPVDPRDFIGTGNGDTSTCIANRVVATDAPSKGSLFSWSLGDPFFKSTAVAFHYGNLTHPSVDPPRIGFLSTVPNNASQLLTEAVQSAQQNGEFEATTQLAPTASAASAPVTTLSMSSVAIASGAGATAQPGAKHTDFKNNSAASIGSGALQGTWTTALVISSIALLFCWI